MRYWQVTLLGLCWTGISFAADGEYLFNAAGCLACHTSEDGEPLAGGRPFETPFGIFYSPNISPHPEAGIGSWSKTDFIQALKHGRAPDGAAYFPVFPYPSYSQMTDADAASIYDYLLTRTAHAQPNKEHELAWWLSRLSMKPWQWWFQAEKPPLSDSGEARGRYLVDALGHCGECHSPRNWSGVVDNSRYLQGNADGPEGEKVPNITQDRQHGIGKWDADDLDYFLQTGELPDGDYTGGPMAEVVDNSTSKLTDADRKAMVDYLLSTGSN